MSYWQLFYHVVWATKNRLPLLDIDVEKIIYNSIRTKAIGLDATIFAINGAFDHVHIVVSIPPKISVSQFVGQVKGVSSAKFNQSGHPKSPLYWQSEYAIFSFDSKRLPHYIKYVENQKEHHAKKTTITILEKTTGINVSSIHEEIAIYETGEVDWLP
jgi:putative transposase